MKMNADYEKEIQEFRKKRLEEKWDIEEQKLKAYEILLYHGIPTKETLKKSISFYYITVRKAEKNNDFYKAAEFLFDMMIVPFYLLHLEERSLSEPYVSIKKFTEHFLTVFSSNIHPKTINFLVDKFDLILAFDNDLPDIFHVSNCEFDYSHHQ